MYLPPELEKILDYAEKWGLPDMLDRNIYILSQPKDSIQSMLEAVEPVVDIMLDWIDTVNFDDELDKTEKANQFFSLYWAWDYANWLIRNWDKRNLEINMYTDE